MCSESVLREFEKTTEVLPFNKYGLSSMQEFQAAETKIYHLEWLKKAGLTSEEVKLYQDNEDGGLDQQKKVEATAMKAKLDVLYGKIKLAENKSSSSKIHDDKVKLNTSKAFNQVSLHKVANPTATYPEGHPMNHIGEIEVDLFGHLHEGEIPPLSKRRKMLRRLERRKAHSEQVNIASCGLVETSKDRPQDNKNFSWSEDDNSSSKEWPDRPAHILNTDFPERSWSENSPTPRNRNDHHPGEEHFNEQPETAYHKYLHSPRVNSVNIEPIGPRDRQLYTIRDGNIVRVERNLEGGDGYEAVEIVIPQNQAEEQLLEGTKMSIDNIRKIDRFKEYEPGVPSKSLYLKNVAPAVTEEQLSILFNQFVQANGGPVRVRLMKAGRMRGQAFVDFEDEEVAVQALSETNGTVMSGRPIIAHFARHVQGGPSPG